MNKTIVLTVTLLLFCRCANDSLTGNDEWSCLPEVEDAYIYPPRDLEGKTPDEVKMYYMIPDNVLKSMSTAGLIHSFIIHPFLGTAYYLSSGPPITTYYRSYEQHNSVQELEERKDAPEALLNYYKSVCFDCLKIYRQSDDFIGERMSMSSRLNSLPVLFTREKILNRYDQNTKKEIVALMLQQQEELKNLQMRTSTLEAMVLIMYADEYAPVVNYFSANLNKEWLYVDNEDGVISFAKDYVKQTN